MKRGLRIAAIAIIAAASGAAALGGAALYAGIYDVSAITPHTRPVNALIEMTVRRSIRVRSADVDLPAAQDAGRIANGFRHFEQHCVQCHGAPGIAPQPFALGLTPPPASLVRTARNWTAADIYWTIENGLKMTGMPAWKYRISADEIADIVAFMRVLPTLSPAEYRAWQARYPAVADVAAAMPASAEAAPGSDARMIGDAAAGRLAIHQYLCATCHVIPGIVGATHRVGPSLQGMASKSYIAGVLPNTEANMVRWLLDPQAVNPGSAMPALGLSGRDARDIAAFLLQTDVE